MKTRQIFFFFLKVKTKYKQCQLDRFDGTVLPSGTMKEAVPTVKGGGGSAKETVLTANGGGGTATAL